jgi:hypothetical protein
LLDTTDLVRRVLGEPVDGVWFMVLNSNMGSFLELLIYIDDDNAYNAFKQANAAAKGSLGISI